MFFWGKNPNISFFILFPYPEAFFHPLLPSLNIEKDSAFWRLNVDLQPEAELGEEAGGGGDEWK